MLHSRRNLSGFISSVTLIAIIVLFAVFALAACGGATATTVAKTSVPSTTVAGSASTAAVEKTFTVAELAAFDGKNGNKAYIAVDGIVYDVTLVAQWGAKMHAGKFQAGKDYSVEIKSAPHGVEKLLTAVKIGVLKG
jgi:predicted heme/steroid binding protein